MQSCPTFFLFPACERERDGVYPRRSLQCGRGKQKRLRRYSTCRRRWRYRRNYQLSLGSAWIFDHRYTCSFFIVFLPILSLPPPSPSPLPPSPPPNPPPPHLLLLQILLIPSSPPPPLLLLQILLLLPSSSSKSSSSSSKSSSSSSKSSTSSNPPPPHPPLRPRSHLSLLHLLLFLLCSFYL